LQSIDKKNNLEKQDSQVIDMAQTIDADHKIILVKKHKMIQRPTKSSMVAEVSAEASTQGLLEAMIPSLECYYQLPANKKTHKQNFSHPPIKSTKPFSRLLVPYLYLLQLPLPKNHIGNKFPNPM